MLALLSRYMCLHMHISMHISECVFHMGQRGKGAIFSLWEVTSHESALFELLSLLNCLHQGHYMVEEPQKQE